MLIHVSVYEIRETAKDYYNNLIEVQKHKAKEMFPSMDLNGDGSVSISKYVNFLEDKGFKSCNNKSFFSKLDKNGDGVLDFDEFISLYYLYRSVNIGEAVKHLRQELTLDN
ncbi:hypothetical protein FNV43_RR02483 [Rhamnella rubrinervis]|uniref:EF-hand domain-containing protein n=1 Tax=Rhamnella rubrinervis TaxID=2594499 RepID=A0A8K0MTT0_9ROSA|nr:hypothetical protein FNV43_RR02483 [Rhamnella rubrinervis]